MTTFATLLTRVLVVLTTSSLGLLTPLRPWWPVKSIGVRSSRSGHTLRYMPGPIVNSALGRVPGLRRLPVAKLLALGEVVMLAREHLAQLDPNERRRFVELMRGARLRPRNLSPAERAELAALIAKANPRLFVGLVADKLSPVPLPRRVVHGPSPKRRRSPRA